MAQSFQETLEEFEFNPEGVPFETEPTLVSPDLEVKGTVVDAKLGKPFQGNDGEWRWTLNLTFSINDPEVREETNLDDPRALWTCWLDIKKGWNGTGTPPLEPPAKNKNIQYGQTLEAFGMNDGRTVKLPYDFMHEECWIRVGRPRTSFDRLAPVAMLGRDKNMVAGRSRK